MSWDSVRCVSCSTVMLSLGAASVPELSLRRLLHELEESGGVHKLQGQRGAASVFPPFKGLSGVTETAGSGSGGASTSGKVGVTSPPGKSSKKRPTAVAAAAARK